MSYPIIYSGQKTDQILGYAQALSTAKSGWIKLESSLESKVSLDTVSNPGNYTVNFWTHGPFTGDAENIPIHVMNGYFNGTLYQLCYYEGTFFTRTKPATGEFSTWKTDLGVEGSFVRDTAPANPSNNDLWYDTSGDTVVVKYYDSEAGIWKELLPGELMQKSIYDTNNKNTDVYNYFDEKIKDIQSSSSDIDYNAHIDNPDIHITDSEMTQIENHANTTLVSTEMDKLKLDLNQLASNNTLSFKETSDQMKADSEAYIAAIKTHIANPVLHPPKSQLDYWRNKSKVGHSHRSDYNISVSVEDIDGNLEEAQLDKDVYEEVVVVDTATDMRALTRQEVQENDLIYVSENKSLYFVENLNNLPIGRRSVVFNNEPDKYTWYDHCKSIAYGSGKYISVGNFVEMSTDLETWSRITSFSDDPLYLYVIYANNLFMIYSDDGFIHTSSDGETWDKIDIGTSSNDVYLAYVNDHFMLTTNDLKFKTSTDGASWSDWKNCPIYMDIILYGNDVYVGFNSESDSFATSVDGETWALHQLSIEEYTASIIDACYGDGRFYLCVYQTVVSPKQVQVVRNGSYILTSTDGTTWGNSQAIAADDIRAKNIIFHNRNVYINTGDSIIEYTNGVAWNAGSMGKIVGFSHICYGNEKFVAVASSNSNISAYSTDGINWTESTLPSSEYWESVCYGKDKFVTIAGANSNKAAYSTDGITWTASTMPSSTRWRSVCYGNDKFVAVAESSNIAAYSTDGINWTAGTLPSNSGYWRSVCYGNGKFVAVASNNKAAYSTDGITWTTSTLPSSVDWQSVCYGNGKFVAIAYNSNKAAYSIDGINWTANTMPRSDLWTSVCYGNGKFVAIVYGSDKAAYSTDGITWTANTLPSYSNWQTVCYGNSKFIIINYHNAKVVYSTNGIEWEETLRSPEKFGNINDWQSVCYGKDKFVAVAYSTNAAYSTNGITWTASTMPRDDGWSSVCYGNGKFVAVARGSNKAAYSTDGINWTESALPSNSQWRSVCYGNGKFVAIVCPSDTTAYSTDGITWTASTMPISAYWYSVCYGKDKFVAVAANTNTAAYSTDGITWTASIMPSNNSWWSVCYGNDKFVAVTNNNTNKVAYSTDGINWTTSTLPSSSSNSGWISVCYGNGKFVAVARSNSNIAAYSTDGINWTANTLPSNGYWVSICYGKDKFVAIADSSNTVAYSCNGIQDPISYESYDIEVNYFFYSYPTLLQYVPKLYLANNKILGSTGILVDSEIPIQNLPYVATLSDDLSTLRVSEPFDEVTANLKDYKLFVEGAPSDRGYANDMYLVSKSGPTRILYTAFKDKSSAIKFAIDEKFDSNIVSVLFSTENNRYISLMGDDIIGEGKIYEAAPEGVSFSKIIKSAMQTMEIDTNQFIRYHGFCVSSDNKLCTIQVDIDNLTDPPIIKTLVSDINIPGKWSCGAFVHNFNETGADMTPSGTLYLFETGSRNYITRNMLHESEFTLHTLPTDIKNLDWQLIGTTENSVVLISANSDSYYILGPDLTCATYTLPESNATWKYLSNWDIVFNAPGLIAPYMLISDTSNTIYCSINNVQWDLVMMLPMEIAIENVFNPSPYILGIVQMADGSLYVPDLNSIMYLANSIATIWNIHSVNIDDNWETVKDGVFLSKPNATTGKRTMRVYLDAVTYYTAVLPNDHDWSIILGRGFKDGIAGVMLYSPEDDYLCQVVVMPDLSYESYQGSIAKLLALNPTEKLCHANMAMGNILLLTAVDVDSGYTSRVCMFGYFEVPYDLDICAQNFASVCCWSHDENVDDRYIFIVPYCANSSSKLVIYNDITSEFITKDFGISARWSNIAAETVHGNQYSGMILSTEDRIAVVFTYNPKTDNLEVTKSSLPTDMEYFDLVMSTPSTDSSGDTSLHYWAFNPRFNTMIYSPNGISWTSANMDLGEDCMGMTYMYQKHMYYSNSNLLTTSYKDLVIYHANNTDLQIGEPSIPYDESRGLRLNAITDLVGEVITSRVLGHAYGNGMYVSIIDKTHSSASMYSVNGYTWIPYGTEFNSWVSCICYGGDKFVAIVKTVPTSSVYSTDGINWEISTAIPDVELDFIAYGNGKFVAIDSGSYAAAYSTDGINWTSSMLRNVNPGECSDFRGIAYGNGKFVAIESSDNMVFTSVDGITWTEEPLNIDSSHGSYADLSFANNQFIMCTAYAEGSKTAYAFYSDDGINWSTVVLGEHEYPNEYACGFGYANGYYYYAVDESNRILYGTDLTKLQTQYVDMDIGILSFANDLVLLSDWNLRDILVVTPIDPSLYDNFRPIYAGSTNATWNMVADKPTDIHGYGITDAYTKEEVDTSTATIVSKKDDLLKKCAQIISQLSEINSLDTDSHVETRASMDQLQVSTDMIEFLIQTGPKDTLAALNDFIG